MILLKATFRNDTLQGPAKSLLFSADTPLDAKGGVRLTMDKKLYNNYPIIENISMGQAM